MPSHTLVELTGFAGLVLATVCLGTVVHELTHAAVLRALDVPCEIVWLPERSAGRLAAGLSGTWAAVVPDARPSTASWGLRLAAVAPLSLAAPFLSIPLGVVPEAAVMGDSARLAVTVAWLGCALPSPQDFSLFWHAERAIADADPRRESAQR